MQVEKGIHAWIWDTNRNAFFASSNNETLLNLCSEGLIESLKATQCSWIKRGVSGFVINPDFMDNECGIQMVKKMSSAGANCARAANMNTP